MTGNLIVTGSTVSVGKNIAPPSGNMLESYPSNIPTEPSAVSNIHTHPVAEPSDITFTQRIGAEFIINLIHLTPGVSPADIKGVSQFNKYWQVMVDLNHVYIYNASSVIQINRR